MKLMLEREPNFKIIANFLLHRIEPMKPYIMPVNPFENHKDAKSSVIGIKETLRHLSDGKIFHNQIFSYSAGYVTSYTIEHHIHIAELNLHKVTVDVTVASSKLKNFLLSRNHNPLVLM